MKIIKKKNIVLLLLIGINCSLFVYSYSLKKEIKILQNTATNHELNERIIKRDNLMGTIRLIIDTNDSEIVKFNKLEKFILIRYNLRDTGYPTKCFINNEFYLFREEYDVKFRNLAIELVNKENLTKDKLENLYNNLDQVFNIYNVRNFTKQNKNDILSKLDYCLEELIK